MLSRFNRMTYLTGKSSMSVVHCLRGVAYGSLLEKSARRRQWAQWVRGYRKVQSNGKAAANLGDEQPVNETDWNRMGLNFSDKLNHGTLRWKLPAVYGELLENFTQTNLVSLY
jgi:hypothetical protein